MASATRTCKLVLFSIGTLALGSCSIIVWGTAMTSPSVRVMVSGKDPSTVTEILNSASQELGEIIAVSGTITAINHTSITLDRRLILSRKGLMFPFQVGDDITAKGYLEALESTPQNYQLTHVYIPTPPIRGAKTIAANFPHYQGQIVRARGEVTNINPGMAVLDGVLQFDLGPYDAQHLSIGKTTVVRGWATKPKGEYTKPWLSGSNFSFRD